MNIVKGKFFFCFEQSKHVNLVTNHTKAIAEGFLKDSNSTSVRLHFTGEIVYGSYTDVELEFLSFEPLKKDLEEKRPILLRFSKEMILGIFVPKE